MQWLQSLCAQKSPYYAFVSLVRTIIQEPVAIVKLFALWNAAGEGFLGLASQQPTGMIGSLC